MRYSVSACSNTGKVRRNNEDNFLLNDFYLEMKHGSCDMQSLTLEPEAIHLLGVFDGMGGYSDGEQASFLTACTAAQYWEEKLKRSRNISQTLTDLCLEANDTVCEKADGSQMGTTCALLCLDGDRYHICNIGDSPVFLLREGELQTLSQEHNQRRMFELATGKAAPWNQKFKLTQCIGIPRDEMLIEPHTGSGTVRDGDVFLLCSDGITDMLHPETLKQILQQGLEPEKTAQALISGALEAGGRDNATVICVRAEAVKKETVPSGKKSFFEGLKEIFIK